MMKKYFPFCLILIFSVFLISACTITVSQPDDSGSSESSGSNNGGGGSGNGSNPDDSGWFHGKIDIDSSGNCDFTDYLDSEGISALPNSDVLSISSEGDLTSYNSPSFHGTMSMDMDTIIGTMSGGPGPYNLMVFQRSGGNYATSDLQGTWTFLGLGSGDNADWYNADLNIDSNGYVLNSNDYNILYISSDGIVTSDVSSYYGVMSQDKETIVFTMDGVGGGHLIGIMLKSGGTFQQSDLYGDWNLHAFVVGDNFGSWIHGMATIYNDSISIVTDAVASHGIFTSDPIELYVSSGGVLTNNGNLPFYGKMSADKSLIVCTMSDGTGSTPGLFILQKKEGTYYQSDLQGTWNLHGLFSANNFSSNTHNIHSSTILADQEFDFSEGQIVDSDGDMVYRSYAWGTTTSSTFTEGEISGNYGDDFSDFLGFLDSQNFLPDAGDWHDDETVYLNDGSFDARWKWTRWVKTTEGRYAIVFVADAETDFLTFIWLYPYGTFTY